MKFVLLALLALFPNLSFSAEKTRPPNILVIWGDDIGQFNISAYNLGMMGYQTPNIDRLARQGALFTDWYGQQSCTAGRAAFITGHVLLVEGHLKSDCLWKQDMPSFSNMHMSLEMGVSFPRCT